MPVGRRFHYQIGGKGFILHRDDAGARSWLRTGRADTPGRRSATDYEYGVLPDELDHPEVWNDWSGGFGHAYRESGQPTYHWSENFDSRFPRQLVHCQAPRVITGSAAIDISQFMYTLEPVVGIPEQAPFAETPAVFLGGGYGFEQLRVAPNSLATLPSTYLTTMPTRGQTRQPILTGSLTQVSYLTQSGNPYLHVVVNGAINGSFTLPYLDMIRTSDRTWISIGGSGNFRSSVRGIIGDDLTATANLTATLLIGGETSFINRMAAFGDQLIAGLNTGLFVGDQSGTFVNVLPVMERSPNPENFRDLLPYGDGILAQSTQGLWFYRARDWSAVVEQVPIKGGRSPVKGYVRALANVGTWLYAGLWTGSASHLIASRDVGLNPEPNWHTLQRFEGQAVSRLFFDGITKVSATGWNVITPRFYVAMDGNLASSAPAYYWPVPFDDDNPLAEQVSFSANYIGSARMDLGIVDWDAPSTPKIFRAVEIESEKLASGSLWCQVYYDIDQTGSYTLLGTSAKSPKDTLYFPSGEGSFVTGHSIALSLRSFTSTQALCPIYRSMIIRGALQPNSVDIITAVTRIADGMVDTEGGQMRSAATMIKELRDFANPNAQGLQAHQLIDLTGAAQWVKVLAPIEEREVYQEGETFPEVAATVKMAVLVYS